MLKDHQSTAFFYIICRKQFKLLPFCDVTKEVTHIDSPTGAAET